jgi:hypothetical protein
MVAIEQYFQRASEVHPQERGRFGDNGEAGDENRRDNLCGKQKAHSTQSLLHLKKPRTSCR